jgi:hypothetical protein
MIGGRKKLIQQQEHKEMNRKEREPLGREWINKEDHRMKVIKHRKKYSDA